jgi:hypothetical protein
MACRDRSLRSSVCKETAWTRHVSNACSNSKNLASVLHDVRCAEAASHVYPTSTASGVSIGSRSREGRGVASLERSKDHLGTPQLEISEIERHRRHQVHRT